MSVPAIRDEVFKKESLTLVKVMDTNEHELHKDVCLVKDKFGQKVILRIGETRAKNFYPQGYQGRYFVVPRLHKTAKLGRAIYELEEYLPGKLMSDILPRPRADKILPDKILRKLIQAYWEWQLKVESKKLKVNWSTENLERFYSSARKFLAPEQRIKIREIISGRRYAKYWAANYPCKWKFSVDNLIIQPDGRIGFIDLARVGKRFWGYDMSWLFWPAWLHFRSVDYKNPRGHLRHLENYFKLIYKLAPTKEKKKKDFFLRCRLIVLERCLGALYDIKNQTNHIKRNLKSIARQKQYTEFVKDLLQFLLLML